MINAIHHPYKSDSPFQAKTSGVRFGSKTADTTSLGADGAQKAQKLGMMKTLRTMRDYFLHHHNREIMKAFVLEYGIPTAVGIGFFAAPPFSWIAGTFVGLPLAWFSGRSGKKRMKALRESGVLHETSGPLARIGAIQGHWKKGDIDAAKNITEEYNRLLDELMSDNDNIKNLEALRDRLKIKTDTKVYRLLNKIFSARMHYANRWQGKALIKLQQISSKIPLKPVRLPILGISLLLQGIMMIGSHRALKQAAAKGVKVVA